MKVSELDGPLLGKWVAKAQGWGKVYPQRFWKDENGKWVCDILTYHPHINGAQAMELVKKYRIHLYYEDGAWIAETLYIKARWGCINAYATTPEVAICRAVVASVYGGEVDG